MDLTHIYDRKVDPEGQDSLARISRFVEPGSTILELGPAIGYFTRYLTETLNCTVDCVEYSAEMARQVEPIARTLHVADLDQIDVRDYFEPAAYDYVIAADVLEHLKNPWRVLQECRALLKPTGAALLSIPNVGHAALIAELIAGRFEYRDEGLLDRTHLRLFTRASIVDMLRRTGFRPDSIERIEWMAEETEFRRELDGLPPRLREYLLMHGDALTYQFIVKATPGDMSADDVQRATSESAGPAVPFFLAKLYWSHGYEGYDEDHCVRRAVPHQKDVCEIHFDLPADAVFNKMRFDPADRPGFIQIQKMRIVEVDDEGVEQSVLLECNQREAITEAFQLEGLWPTSSALSKAMIASDDDPKLFYQSETEYAPAPGNHFRLEVQMHWPIGVDYLVAQSMYGSVIGELEAQLAASEERERGLREAAMESHQQITKLTQERDEAAQFEHQFIQQEARTRDVEQALREIHDSKAWRFVMKWRQFKGLFRRG